ncbi:MULTISPECIES: glucose PTS transporter subunit IIA [unclassified Paenibacillus]|uniref:glucose PTS transporter subunit IIA n=1 Tax=unclassified Paenibacillus TaxID=185978 RepID=UPI0003E2929D|nr:MULTISPECIES: glucose PTS transporter subunit IIA [unclassified Paenibacillus]ETT56206.1 PTS system transporter subunit IIC [Paenibacillus sp. FSL R7-269]OMG00946.1 PTS beta-glucoside transporter subunit EIIBCA [Paenibacillus sp. FSL R7-0337]
MTTEDLAKEIIANIGQDNITYATHCATRLRFNVKDESQVNLKALDRLEGVLRAQFNSGQLQIIIGAKVKIVFDAVSERLNLENLDIEVKSVKQKKNVISRVVETIAGIFGPVIPVLIGCGMVKSVLAILTTMKLLETTSGAYVTFNLISDLIFYFFPFFLAVSAAKKFRTNEYLAVALAGAYMYPTIMEGAAKAAETGITSLSFFGLPLLLVNYKSTIIPVILSVWVMSYVYRFVDKRIPDMFKILFVPMLVLFIMVPLGLIAIGPLGTYIGKGVAEVVTYLYTVNGVIGSFLFGTFRPILIIFGMHYAITPINSQLIAEYGYSVISPANLTGNLAQAGACLGVFLLLKHKASKSSALSSGVTALFGITEPAIFGFNLKYKRPFICAMLAGGIGAAYINFWGGGATALILPGILALPTYIADSYIHIIIGISISITLAMGAVLIWGIEEDIPATANAASGTPATPVSPVTSGTARPAGPLMICSPINGTIKDISAIDDPIFALGSGAAVESVDGKVYAPFNGKVVSLFPTRHAIGLMSDEGVEMLVHVGINTVKLKGKHFTAHVQQDQIIRQGDVLLEYDVEAIRAAGYDTVVPIIISNTFDYQGVEQVAAGHVAPTQHLLRIQV